MIAKIEYSEYFDGLRGIAIIFVLLSHLGNSGIFILPIEHNAIGKIGVWLFFILSAFLLTNRFYFDLLNSKDKEYCTYRFIIRRIFRIYPLFIFTLIIHLYIGHFDLISLVKHFFLIEGYGELWAISVEFQYYFLIIGIVYLSIYLSIKVLSLITLIFLIVSYSYSDLIFSNSLVLLVKILPFWIGSIIALKVPFDNLNNKIIANKKIIHFLAIISFIFVLITAYLYRTAMLENNLNHTFFINILLTVSFCVFLIFSYYSSYIKKIISSTPLVFVGKISFSLYLMHMFVLEFLKDYNSLMIILSIFILSYLTYIFIEKPFIGLGSKLASITQRNGNINDKI